MPAASKDEYDFAGTFAAGAVCFMAIIFLTDVRPISSSIVQSILRRAELATVKTSRIQTHGACIDQPSLFTLVPAPTCTGTSIGAEIGFPRRLLMHELDDA